MLLPPSTRATLLLDDRISLFSKNKNSFPAQNWVWVSYLYIKSFPIVYCGEMFLMAVFHCPF